MCKGYHLLGLGVPRVIRLEELEMACQEGVLVHLVTHSNAANLLILMENFGRFSFILSPVLEVVKQ
jgi:hypothetical protein